MLIVAFLGMVLLGLLLMLLFRIFLVVLFRLGVLSAMNHMVLLEVDGLDRLQSAWHLSVTRKQKGQGQEAQGFALIH